MKITVQMEREMGGSTVAQWEEFLAEARRMGASGVTEVEEEVDDDMVLTAWSVALEQGSAPPSPENVTVPTRLLQNLIYVASHVANGDGDARGLVEPAKETMDQVNEHFQSLALGPNPFRPAD